jgi:hypothetical protein
MCHIGAGCARVYSTISEKDVVEKRANTQKYFLRANDEFKNALIGHQLLAWVSEG